MPSAVVIGILRMTTTTLV